MLPNFDGLFTFLIAAGLVVGVVGTLLVMWLWPYIGMLWNWIGGLLW